MKQLTVWRRRGSGNLDRRPRRPLGKPGVWTRSRGVVRAILDTSGVDRGRRRRTPHHCADGVVMTSTPHVFVLFGATGDLAKRKLFPACTGWRPRASARGVRHHRVGPALAGSDDEFRDKIRGSLEEFVDDLDDKIVDDLLGRLTFQTSDADDGKDLAAAVKKALSRLGEDCPHADLPVDTAEGDPGHDQDARPRRPDRRRPRRRREAVRHRPANPPANWTPHSRTSSARTRCTGSTTSWERKRCRTSWRCASPTDCSNRRGTATIWCRCRSTCPRN